MNMFAKKAFLSFCLISSFLILSINKARSASIAGDAQVIIKSNLTI